MLVLAIDTALGACSVAILDTEAARLLAQESVAMARGHAEALMPMAARVVEQSGVDFAQLDRIAVTTGPGSFTGLRVGLSAARGLALAAGKPAIGLTTLTAFAAPMVGRDPQSPILAAIDARHGQIYLQAVTDDGTTLIAPRIAPIEEAAAVLRWGAPRIVGNAAALVADLWPSDQPPASVEPRATPDIGWVAWVGAAASPETAPARPFYLRAPDARPAARPAFLGG